MTWDVRYHPEADAELRKLPRDEIKAVLNVVSKLEVAGPTLPFPHSSSVNGAEKLRELRPRRGNSPWRAFYRRIGDVFVIGAVGPEANVDRRGFRRATSVAGARLDDVEE